MQRDPTMNTRQGFGKSLKMIRAAKGLTQEDFSTVSSRTYLSTLERGLKSPTLEKIEDLCETLEVHPLSLLVITYLNAQNSKNLDKLLKKVEAEVKALLED
jgi:transcriptional regulator with XRE-family HTH domain